MATVNRYPADDNDNYFLFIKGAPEKVLKMSGLQDNERKLVLEKIENWAKKGLKVLGLAFQKISLNDTKKISIKNIPQLQWGGVVGFWDPPRERSKRSAFCCKASRHQGKSGYGRLSENEVPKTTFNKA